MIGGEDRDKRSRIVVGGYAVYEVEMYTSCEIKCDLALAVGAYS